MVQVVCARQPWPCSPRCADVSRPKRSPPAIYQSYKQFTRLCHRFHAIKTTPSAQLVSYRMCY
jgi:hypothetical protein